MKTFKSFKIAVIYVATLAAMPLILEISNPSLCSSGTLEHVNNTLQEINAMSLDKGWQASNLVLAELQLP